MKACSKCGSWQRDSQFYPEKRPGRSRDGLHHACKSCERTAAAARARARYTPRNTMSQVRDECGRFRRAA